MLSISPLFLLLVVRQWGRWKDEEAKKEGINKGGGGVSGGRGSFIWKAMVRRFGPARVRRIRVMGSVSGTPVL